MDHRTSNRVILHCDQSDGNILQASLPVPFTRYPSFVYCFVHQRPYLPPLQLPAPEYPEARPRCRSKSKSRSTTGHSPPRSPPPLPPGEAADEETMKAIMDEIKSPPASPSGFRYGTPLELLLAAGTLHASLTHYQCYRKITHHPL